MKVGICTCVKNERPYLREWITHYRALSFDSIYIYDNESNDATRELLHDLAGADLHVMTWPTMEGESPQRTAFEKCAAVCKHEVDFLAFFDVDEFLIEIRDGTLRSLLSSLDRFTEGVLVNQRIVGSNGQRHYSPLPVMERFPKCTTEEYVENVWVKSIVRPGSVVRFDNPHIPITHQSKFSTAHGKLIGQDKFDATGKMPTVDHNALALNHYILKSYEEFLWKRHRGGGASKSAEGRFGRYKEDAFFNNRQIQIDKGKAIRCRSLSDESMEGRLAQNIVDLGRAPVPWTLRRPMLTKRQREWLLTQMPKHDLYVDYGVSEAILDAIYAGVKTIGASHSSTIVLETILTHTMIRSAVDVGRLHLSHADIGPVDEYGGPLTKSGTDVYRSYPASTWNAIGERCYAVCVPLVLVTGRFRVACACYAALMNPQSVILIRDFCDRAQYNDVLNVFDLRQTIDGGGVFSMKPGSQRSALASTIERHLSESL